MSRLQAGFTLVELLVAIMILALLTTASMGSVRMAMRSTTASLQRADKNEEMRAVTDFLRRQFHQLPHMQVGEGKERRLAFAADSKRLRFVAPAPLFSYGAGLMIYTLAAQPMDGGGEVLTLTHAPFDPGAGRFDTARSSPPVILSTRFERVEFDYFGAEMAGDQTHWQPAWRQDAEQLPSAIRLRTHREPGGEGWPDMVFTLYSGRSS